MSPQQSYWEDCIEVAAQECGVALTAEQLDYMAGAVEGCHENYGLSHHSPSSSDRLADIEREWKKKLLDQEKGYEQELRELKDNNIDLQHSKDAQNYRLNDLVQELKED